jgi:hypothetical protein
MKAQKHFKIAAIIVMLLGIIHTCATPVVFPFFKSTVKIDLPSVYMFVMVGLYTFFIGWLQYFILKKISQGEAFMQILKVTIVLISLLGIGAVAIVQDNPFAYIALFVALYELILLRFIMKNPKTFS